MTLKNILRDRTFHASRIKHGVAMTLIAFACGPALAAPVLTGQWKSDRALTMDFNGKHVQLEKKTSQFLFDLMGRMTLTFAHGRLQSLMPDVDLSIEGKPRHIAGFDEDAPVTVIYSGENIVVVLSEEIWTHRKIVTTYNFDDDDTMWIYSGGADKAMRDSHFREYFRRVR